MIEQTDSGETIKIPMHFTHYNYVKTIGSGASAVVILVKDEIVNTVFAAKVVSRKTLIEENRIEYFERELRIVQNLRHQYIVAVHDVVYLKDLIIILLEYCENGDLLTFITNQGIMNSTLARKLFFQLVTALDYLHSKQIAHRDLKPENVFLDANCNIKLGDFGLSKETKNTLLSTLCGTLYYSAPEVINHISYDGLKADIWSLGILLFCIVNGTLPWRGASAEEISEEISNGLLVIPEEFPLYVEEIVRKCTAIEPNDRITTQEILNCHWLRNEQVSAMGQSASVLKRKSTAQSIGLTFSATAKPSSDAGSMPYLQGKKKFSLPPSQFLKQPIRLVNKNTSKASIPQIKTFAPVNPISVT